jgi:hypothetical protein
MLKCPFCGKEINSLETKGSAWYRVKVVDFKGHDVLDYELIDDNPEKEQDYQCPECYEVLACSREGARAFLMHGELLDVLEPRRE